MRRIVVSLRTCPTRLLGPYGCEWIETPNLDRFAAEGVVFDGHYATTLGTKSPSRSYVETVNGFDSPEMGIALERLAQSENGALSVERDAFLLPWGEWDEGPLNLDDEETRDRFFENAEEIVARFDAQFGEWIEKLREHRLDESALLTVTAESGLPLGEHGILGITGSRLHEELVHLPLLVRFPDRRFAGYRVAKTTTFEDIQNDMDLVEWEQIIRGEEPKREFLISTLGEPPRELALRTADSCLIFPSANPDSSPLLFDRPDDRFEVNDHYGRQPDRAEEMVRSLRKLHSR